MPKILWTYLLDGPLLQCNCPLRVQKSRRARDAINLTRRSLTWIGAFPAPINGVNSGRAGNKHSDHSRKNYLSIVIHLNEMQHLKQSASLICFEFTYICYKSVSTPRGDILRKDTLPGDLLRLIFLASWPYLIPQ